MPRHPGPAASPKENCRKDAMRVITREGEVVLLDQLIGKYGSERLLRLLRRRNRPSETDPRLGS